MDNLEKVKYKVLEGSRSEGLLELMREAVINRFLNNNTEALETNLNEIRELSSEIAEKLSKVLEFEVHPLQVRDVVYHERLIPLMNTVPGFFRGHERKFNLGSINDRRIEEVARLTLADIVNIGGSFY